MMSKVLYIIYFFRIIIYNQIMKKIVYIFIICLLFITNTNAESINLKFSKCIDGDTAEFIYDEETIKVRMLAIDTPETVHPTKGEEPFGKDASNYTCDKITNAKKIILEFDDNSEKVDKYDRYLGWIFVDDSLLQKKLIENGLAKVAYLYGNYKYTEELQKAEKIAQEKKLNIWNDYKEENDYSWIIFIVLSIIVLIPCIIKKEA